MEDAWFGFEGTAYDDPSGFFLRHALQFKKDRLVLTKMTVACHDGNLYVTSCDGGVFFYEALLQEGQQEGEIVLRYTGCERCIGEVHAPEWRQTLSLRRISETQIRLGEIVYDRNRGPYPERCPPSGR